MLPTSIIAMPGSDDRMSLRYPKCPSRATFIERLRYQGICGMVSVTG